MSGEQRPEAVLLIGVEACGKSSFVPEHLFASHVRINLDMLRTRNRERLMLETCLAARQPFVVDNTNLTRVERARYLEPAAAANFTRVGYYFQSAIGTALERNAARDGRARVPDVAVKSAFSRLELPSLEEGFEALYYVRLEGGRFVVEDWRA